MKEKYLETLYDICESLMKELDKANEKIRMGGGEISSGDVEYLDKLTHAIKSVKTTIAMEEADHSYGGSYDDGYNNGSSNARDRRGNVRRDSMGRYSRDYMPSRGRMDYRGYSRDDAKKEMMERLEDMKEDAVDEKTRQMVHEWINELKRG